MADWSSSATDLITPYATVLSNLKLRDIDAYTLSESPTNPPDGAVRYSRASNRFEEWDQGTTAWIPLVLSVSGGGTGGSSQVAAQAGLGLGTMAVQNSNAVSISGGGITGLSGLGVSGNATIAGTLSVGSTAVNGLQIAGGLRAGSGPVDIIGTNGKIPALAPAYFNSQNISGNWTMTGGGFFLWDTTGLGAPTLTSRSAGTKIVLFPSLSPTLVDSAIGTETSGVWFSVPGTSNNFKFYIGINEAARLDNTALKVGLYMGLSGSANIQIGTGIVFRPSANTGVSLIDDTGINLGVRLTIGGVIAATGTGSSVLIQNNSGGSGAAGSVGLLDRAGNLDAVWADATGVLRIGSAAPTANGSVSDTSGTVVGSQTSNLDSKELIVEFKENDTALSMLVQTPLFKFRYRDGRFEESDFMGIVTNYSPFLGMDNGKSLNVASAVGYLIAAIKALNYRTLNWNHKS